MCLCEVQIDVYVVFSGLAFSGMFTPTVRLFDSSGKRVVRDSPLSRRLVRLAVRQAVSATFPVFFTAMFNSTVCQG